MGYNLGKGTRVLGARNVLHFHQGRLYAQIHWTTHLRLVNSMYLSYTLIIYMVYEKIRISENIFIAQLVCIITDNLLILVSLNSTEPNIVSQL